MTKTGFPRPALSDSSPENVKYFIPSWLAQLLNLGSLKLVSIIFSPVYVKVPTYIYHNFTTKIVKIQ